MKNVFEVEEITNNNDVVLSKEDFDRFVSEYDLPVFKYKYTTKYKAFKWENKSKFTIFHGVHICLKIETTQIEPKP